MPRTGPEDGGVMMWRALHYYASDNQSHLDKNLYDCPHLRSIHHFRSAPTGFQSQSRPPQQTGAWEVGESVHWLFVSLREEEDGRSDHYCPDSFYRNTDWTLLGLFPRPWIDLQYLTENVKRRRSYSSNFFACWNAGPVCPVCYTFLLPLCSQQGYCTVWKKFNASKIFLYGNEKPVHTKSLKDDCCY